jgi:hypothetical protein
MAGGRSERERGDGRKRERSFPLGHGGCFISCETHIPGGLFSRTETTNPMFQTHSQAFFSRRMKSPKFLRKIYVPNRPCEARLPALAALQQGAPRAIGSSILPVRAAWLLESGRQRWGRPCEPLVPPDGQHLWSQEGPSLDSRWAATGVSCPFFCACTNVPKNSWTTPRACDTTFILWTVHLVF